MWDLTSLPLHQKVHPKAAKMVEFMRNIHEEVKKKIEVSNVIYKVVAVKHKKHLTFKRLKLQERKRFFFFFWIMRGRLALAKFCKRWMTMPIRFNYHPIYNTFNVQHLLPYHASMDCHTNTARGKVLMQCIILYYLLLVAWKYFVICNTLIVCTFSNGTNKI